MIERNSKKKTKITSMSFENQVVKNYKCISVQCAPHSEPCDHFFASQMILMALLGWENVEKNVPGRFWSLNWLYFAIFGPDIAFYVQYGQAEVPPTLPEWQVTQTNNFRPVGTELVACVGLTHSYMLLDWSKVQIHHFFMLFAPLKTRWGPVTWARARFSKVQTPLS